MLKNYGLVLSFALLSACGDSSAPQFKPASGGIPTPTPTPGPMPGSAPTLENSKWFLQYIGSASTGETQQMPVTAPFTLQLQRDRSVSGYADCNGFTGEYSPMGNNGIRIAISGLDSAVCEGEAGRDAAAINEVITILQDVERFELTKIKLTLEAYGEQQLVFEPLFGGCSAPQAVTGLARSSTVLIVGRDAEALAELVVEYQIAHEDFALQGTSGQEVAGQVVARMSDNTLQRLRCDPRVVSLQYRKTEG
jgi:heat shock protein HslJ